MSLRIGGKWYRRTDFKLTLWYIFTFTTSTLVIFGFLYFRLRHQLIKEIDQFLLDETRVMERVLSRTPQESFFLMTFEDEVLGRKYYPFFFQILDREGTPLYTSEGFRALGYAVSETVLTNAKNGKETRERFISSKRRTPYRIISTPVYQNGTFHQIIQIGTHLHFARKNLVQFRNSIFIGLLTVLVLGTVGGWVLARRSLSPIRYITSKTQTITSKNLGERLGTRGTGDEIDELIHTINEMIARLDSSFKQRAEFIADVSHELKTPLCALKGEAEVLLSGRRSLEEYQEAMVHFLEEFEKMNRMINDLILLSKFDSNQAELHFMLLSLDSLLSELVHLFRVLAEQKNIELLAGPFPQVTVAGDKTRLQQLFTNLIDNAIKYTQKGRIRITMEKNEEVVRVKVEDTGIGIPKEEQAHIFKRFYRVDKSRSKETGGVGLGLSIAEKIAHAHRGKIEVESQLGQGTTFTVYLPIFKP
ncbi:MAG: HAMP domain-containing histidine kinase [Desulfobacterota bacterium]|nr:HAMP domain-containing histidine kinase [Thermodesulfobacteriota bacterium]